MAVIANSYPTLVDVASRLDPNGAIASIAEQMAKQNPILDDIPWVEGNLATGHRLVARTALPSPTWRRFNQGVDPTVSSTAPYDESCGMMEAYSYIDVDLAKLNGNSMSWRASEDAAYLEAFNQELATGVFYHSTKTDPEKFYGLAPRYASTSGTSGSYCLKTGTVSTTGTYSIWLINWSPDRIFGIYPKGSTAGLSVQDLGEQLVTDTDSKRFLAYATRYQWKCGLAVKDYRYACRMLVDSDDTSGSFSDTSKALISSIYTMFGTVYSMDGMPTLYMSRTVYNKLATQLINAQSNLLDWAERGGKRVRAFDGVPIRITDALVSETAAY